MPEALQLRGEPQPALLVRLGSNTLTDEALAAACEDTHDRWGLWGFSVFEAPGGDILELPGGGGSSPTGGGSSWRLPTICVGPASRSSTPWTACTGPS